MTRTITQNPNDELRRWERDETKVDRQRQTKVKKPKEPSPDRRSLFDDPEFLYMLALGKSYNLF